MDPKKPMDIPGLSNFAELLSKGMGNAKPGEKPAWWQTYQYPEPPYVYVDDFIKFTRIACFFQALSYGNKVFDYEYAGDFIGLSEAIVPTLEKQGAKLVYSSLERADEKKTGFFFLIEDGAMFVQVSNWKTAKLNYQIVSASKTTFEKYKNAMKGFFPSVPKKNPLYMISAGSHDTEFVQLGSFAVPLNTENYSTDVLAGYHHVVKQFNSKEPSGRLLLLTGLPGTGKTYIVRGLLNDLDSGTFLMAPPDMVGDLTKPKFVKNMLEASQNKFSSGPLYLIIEDADIALLRRSGDNMGVVSSLLNLADGLLGSAFDLRIIATTNANKIDIEPAILRPGRLCKSILLDKLPVTQANDLLKKLNPAADKVYSTPVILADIYASAAEASC